MVWTRNDEPGVKRHVKPELCILQWTHCMMRLYHRRRQTIIQNLTCELHQKRAIQQRWPKKTLSILSTYHTFNTRFCFARCLFLLFSLLDIIVLSSMDNGMWISAHILCFHRYILLILLLGGNRRWCWCVVRSNEPSFVWYQNFMAHFDRSNAKLLLPFMGNSELGH